MAVTLAYGSPSLGHLFPISTARAAGFVFHDERRLGPFLTGILRIMNTVKLTRWLRLCASVLAAGGLALSALGLASATAQAAPSPVATYHHHWCPGDRWDPGWGNNWDWNNCHDWDDN